ncbi:hypothetical protein ADK76_33390 [Streptomyces griseoflavus]|uniref:hypothetical protein n=1 Tax=Streptomyces rimosus TaxID=1927 RepID=UPI0004C5821D|nr:hypothetical protein [Streptomyces rimosus]KOG52055.1 hypothetical protein ADK76_33390 [Streptomyces griseoflavus]
MSGRGRKAPLPPPGYKRRPTVDASGLVVSPLGQGGEDLGTWDFSAWPGAEGLRREIAAAFARRAREHWNSFDSCQTYAKSLRHFVAAMAKEDPVPACVAEVTVGAWERWSADDGAGRRKQQVALILRETGQLAADVSVETSKRRRSMPAAVKESFSKSEMKRVRDAAARTVRQARLRIGGNLALLEQWRSGQIPAGRGRDGEEWKWGELLDYLARTGDLPRCPSGGVRLSVRRRVNRRMGFWDIQLATTLLFPTVSEKGAAAVLLICHEGYNLSVLKKLTVPDQWPNGDGHEEEPAIHRVATDKPRRKRRRHSSNNLVNLGEESSGWAMQQVIDMTRQARVTLGLLGQPSDLLLWSRPARNGALFSHGGTALADAISQWAEEARQAGTNLPAGLSARQLRHTSQVLYGGPRNNSAEVQESQYERRDKQVIEDSPDVVAAGLEQAVRHARETVAMRVVTPGDEQSEEEAICEQSGLSRQAAAQVVRGELDTPVAACEDVEHSPLAQGGPCTVSFLLCFACPNALATARHLPRIIYLFQALEALRSAVTPAVWAADWGAHHARVEDLLTKHTDRANWPTLLATLPDRDKDLIDRTLERRLDP